MAVPPVNALFLPILKVLHDRGQLSRAEVRPLVSDNLNLTEEDKREMLPSGSQRRLDNRMGWARVHLSKAGLVRTVRKGVYELTDAGRALMEAPPSGVDVAFLRRYPSYVAWEEQRRAASNAESQEAKDQEPVPNDVSPMEGLNRYYRLLREGLAEELAEALQEASWQRFEEIVVDVLLALGYGGSRGDAGHAFRASGDGGVDGVINEDRLGFSKIYVQAKRYGQDRTVGRPDVQAFVGSLLGQKSKQGVFLTTGRFSADARSYVSGLSELKVVLIDGPRLAELMMDFDVGVSEEERFVVKRLDRDYFDDI